MDGVLVCGRGRDGKPLLLADVGKPVLSAIAHMRAVLIGFDAMRAYLVQPQPTAEQLHTAGLL